MNNKKKTKRRLITAVVIIALLVLLAVLSDFIIDWMWFAEMGYVSVFFTELFTKLKLGGPAFVLAFLICFAFMAAIRKSFLKKNEMVLKDAKSIRFINIVSVVLSVLFGVIFASTIIPDLWFQILQLLNSSDFGVADPLFGNDISFYVFKLEFWEGINDAAIGLTVLLFAVTLIFHSLLVGLAKPQFTEADTHDYNIPPQDDPAKSNANFPGGVIGRLLRDKLNQRRTSSDAEDLKKKGAAVLSVASRQISILAALFFLSLGLNFFLARYELLYSGTGIAYGAGFTDINVTLPMYLVLTVLCGVGVVVVPVAIGKRKWKLAAAVPALMIAVGLLGNVAAVAVQNLVVSPDELDKESAYLENNITYTRLAYDLQDIDVRDMDPDTSLTTVDVLNNMDTFSNIRINDFEPAEQFYNQTQSIRSYYEFNDVDVDRYYINGEYTQCFLSAREIDQSRIDDSWLIKHLKYTHGYGLTLSRVDRVTSSGQPDMLIESIPPVSEVPEITIDRPEIYYGESTDTYVITGTAEAEFDYPSGESNVYCEYEGTGGIKLNFFTRCLFALKEQSLKILISNNIDADSSILIYRNIAERMEKIAPFLTYDDDPYVVASEGKIYWIADAYTVSEYYPYSEPWENSSALNYVRNSVKVVVDAYNGTTDFYLVDDSDPIALTLAKIYPGLFKTLDQMPEDLRSHLQYPNALFNIQAAVYEKYHMTDVDVFYQSEDLWQISDELYGQETVEMTPNYFIMKLPGEDSAEFVSTISYCPSGKSNLTGILMARSDGENYGELVLYRMPKDRIIYGPAQIEAQINQNAEISKEFSLWNNSGSSYSRGNMFCIPVENSLLYCEPIYLEASTGSLPEVKRVVMFYGDQVAYESTLAECLDALFGDGAGDPLLEEFPVEAGRLAAQALEEGGIESFVKEGNSTAGSSGAAGSASGAAGSSSGSVLDSADGYDLKTLAAKAQEAYDNAVAAQKNGDWAAYGQYLDELEQLLQLMTAED